MKSIQPFSIRSVFALFALILILNPAFGQDAGIFQTYIVLDVNNGGNQFLAGGINADNAPQFAGTNFGNPTSLVLNGGEIKTFKNNGGDVTAAEINYRVYEQGQAAPNFTSVNLPFNQNLGNPGDQKWQEALAGIDLLAGLTPGNYNLEVYWKINTNVGDKFDSNFGQNFIGTFGVNQVVPALSEWGLIILGLTFLSMGAIVMFRRREDLVAA